jgi:hypothetical protein
MRRPYRTSTGACRPWTSLGIFFRNHDTRGYASSLSQPAAGAILVRPSASPRRCTEYPGGAVRLRHSGKKSRISILPNGIGPHVAPTPGFDRAESSCAPSRVVHEKISSAGNGLTRGRSLFGDGAYRHGSRDSGRRRHLDQGGEADTIVVPGARSKASETGSYKVS